MARDTSGQPWKFDGVNQGQGIENTDSWLRLGTFTSATTEITTMAGHGLNTGDPIRVEEGSNNDLPSGLAESTDYWITWLSTSTLNICSSHANAIAGTAVTIADVGTTPNYLLQQASMQVPVFVSTIVIDAGSTGGTFEVTDKSSGRSLTGSLEIAANAHEQIVVNEYVGGVYMTSMDDGQILVYHGE